MAKITTKTINIDLDKNLCSFIESKMYDVNARKDLLISALELGKNIHSDSFEAYQKEYVDLSREYNLAINQMIDDHIKPILKEQGITADFTYNVNFETTQVEITYKD